MSKKKAAASLPRDGGHPPGARSAPRKPSDRKDAPSKGGFLQSWFSAGAIRELVEAVVIAFALAFFVRTFEAEAFVIPTGSMAPTLMGRHKDLVCPKCGYAYRVTASEEVDNRTGRLIVDEETKEQAHQIIAGTCPICRFTMDLDLNNPQRKTYRSFKGDRILVAKFPYYLASPDRWDVAVFTYPGEARVNYIKRLVGKPEETLLIRRGDIFARPKGEDRFTIERKPPAKIVAMMQPVHDNDYLVPDMARRGWPPRWMVEPRRDSGAAWQTSEDLKSFSTDGSCQGEIWLSYRHYVPTYEDWRVMQRGGRFDLRTGHPRPQLITDFAAYNTQHTVFRAGSAQSETTAPRVAGEGPLGMGPPPAAARLGLHWVGDLVLECTLTVQGRQGQFLMALVEGGAVFQCELDVATGKATLLVDGAEPFETVAQTRVSGPGKYDLRFANVDDQLVLWVNGRVVPFDPKPWYVPRGPAPLGTDAKAVRPNGPGMSQVGPDPQPTEADLRPARIGSRGLAATVAHVRLFRDVYYIATRSQDKPTDYDFPQQDRPSESPHGESSPDPSAGETGLTAEPPKPVASHPLVDPTAEKLAALFSDPDRWSCFNYRREVSFDLGPDQFLMLGDNSAESKDSRLWESSDGTPYYVRRDLLKGKALWIYWPHSWDRIPWTDRVSFLPNGIWFPLFPNFSRMRFVR